MIISAYPTLTSANNIMLEEVSGFYEIDIIWCDIC